jgi:agmatinase
VRAAPGYGLALAPYEKTTSYAAGAALGPEAVLRDLEKTVAGDAAPRRVDRIDGRSLAGPRPMMRALAEVSSRQSAEGLLPVMVGGEHTCTLGFVLGLAPLYPSLGVIHLDAHADQRREYGGSRYSHASVMRRIAEDMALPVLSIGVRALSAAEARFIGERGVGLVPGSLLREWPRLLPPLLRRLPRAVYLTIDMDFFDPSVVPGVGTPEPGGADWFTAMDIIREILREKCLVGFDIVELCPPREKRRSVRAAVRTLLAVLERAVSGCESRRL